ncbi:MAG: sigma-70 family RNA polymerase sigma factor [Phycisphaerae bacterium]|jgi:RNA polymerase sigma-70 factor (ECF subfamily)|nr:sigma-70 family RNA polymerase sigma factor [Phycisphaerae bacterium]
MPELPFNDPPAEGAPPQGAGASAADEATVTRLLGSLNAGDASARETLLVLLYNDLRRQASSYFRAQRGDHTLQPTALVHEAFVRIAGNANISWEGRSHFLAVAAKAMRNVLADHARKRRAEKRGGAWERVTLTGLGSDDGERMIDALDLDEALAALQQADERQARIVELRFYGGLSVDEVAHLLEVSPRTVDLDWRMARAWLRNRLDERRRT